MTQSSADDADQSYAAAQPEVLRSSAPRRIIPTGEHTLRMSRSLAAELAGRTDDDDLELEASRVWIGRSKGRYVVHIGEVRVCRPESSG